MAVYDRLRDELLTDPLLGEQPAFARDYLKEVREKEREGWKNDALGPQKPTFPTHPTQMIDYNVPGGKLNRGMAVADALAALRSTTVEALPTDDRFKADVAGWCIEWLQAFFLVADDIMDNSVTRRGQPCWYRQPAVGLLACNDYIVLESCLYRILSRHFGSTPYYARLLDLFHDTTHQTAHGQQLDVTTAPAGSVDLSRYTQTNYERIVTYKTAFYSFYLPVAAGLMVGGVEPGVRAYDVAKSVCVKMGVYFQIQDDVLDCFGDPATIGKIGTDIQDNKCSWLVVQAAARATADQKKVLEANYGKDDDASVAAVKALYRDLKLEAAFHEYEDAVHADLVAEIEGQADVPAGVFMPLLAKIFKRSK